MKDYDGLIRNFYRAIDQIVMPALEREIIEFLQVWFSRREYWLLQADRED